MIEFFTSVDVSLSTKMLEVLYMFMGLTAAYVGVKSMLEKDHPARFETGVFWLILGVLFAFGRWIPNLYNGILIVVMSIPAILNRVKRGNVPAVDKVQAQAMAQRIGNKIFIPTLMMGLFAILFALFTEISALVGVGVGVVVAMLLTLGLSKGATKPIYFVDDARRMLDAVGPLSLLPMMLAALGAIFTSAGVGDVVSALVGGIIPEGNTVIGVIVFAIGMALFTMVMGNAFAAITVMTIGIGAPFVLAYGMDPNVVGILALTCGYCGTLMTPMAANFNIVPIAVLEMKDKYGVIKKQIPIALVMLTVQIIYILLIG
ncbi:MAG: DUF979 domain-containing protein [Erysipelotrichaceae bacterium]